MLMARPVIVAHHTRSGLAALNVVTAALQTDPLTDGVEVRFARDRAALAAGLTAAAGAGAVPVAAWSFYSPDFLESARDLSWVRARAPGLHVAGGVHATAEPLATLRAGFDLVALGEGEATAVALASTLIASGDPRDLPGIAFLRQDRLVSNGPGERRALDDFPAFNARARKWNALEITRGCIYACSFCQTPFMFKARFRHRSVGNVRAQVARMRESGTVRYARFLTPTCLSYGSTNASADLDAVEELLAAVREELPEGKIYFGTFPSECRPEHVTPAALRVLKKYVDNDQLVIGGQSGSDRVLRATHRGHTVEDVRRAARACLEAGFVPTSTSCSDCRAKRPRIARSPSPSPRSSSTWARGSTAMPSCRCRERRSRAPYRSRSTTPSGRRSSASSRGARCTDSGARSKGSRRTWSRSDAVRRLGSRSQILLPSQSPATTAQRPRTFEAAR